MDTSEKLFEQAQKVMPGGVNSPVRAYRAVGMTPRFIQSAKGAYITDVDGVQYIDYVGSWGPMILGHANSQVLRAVEQTMKNGLSFGAPTERETDLANLVVSMVPHIEMVRMVNSGTEAVMSAVRVARGATGKDKIIKFEGCYHGHSDCLLVNAGSSALAAAKIAGATKIFKVGGAQAVAALAYGTQRIPKVDKIVGPGNIFVATAKKLLYGVVDIDMVAGPSEILIVADSTADAAFLAADLMSQAEHDMRASAILLTTSESLAKNTLREIDRQIKTLVRQEIIQKSFDDYGEIIVCDNLRQALDFANELAPEHLELCVAEPLKYIGMVDNAGSVFLGNWSPEPLGDYYAGPNHVLPTSGTARFFSPLSVDSFVKKSSFIYYTPEELKKAKDDIMLLAETEGLTAHANSIKVRFE